MPADPLKDAMVAHLTADPAVAALAGDRVSPWGAHQGESYPRVVYRRLATDRGMTFDGGHDGLPRTLVRLECWAELDSDAVALAKAVRDCTGGFRGSWGSLAVQAAFVVDESDAAEFPAFGSDGWVYQASLDLEVWHEEEAALTPGAGGGPAAGYSYFGRGYFG